jgi:hypothetical protein
MFSVEGKSRVADQFATRGLRHGLTIHARKRRDGEQRD